jgi:hypothetical protein
LVSLVTELEAMLHTRNADAYLIGEYAEAFMAQHIDLCMSWYTKVEKARMAAYTLPQAMHCWVVDRDIPQSCRAFAMGLYLCLCTRGIETSLAAAPEFAEHVLKLANLRRRCLERTVYARFRDQRGILASSGANAEAYAFDSDRGPAVIVAAPGDAASISIEVDRGCFGQGVNGKGRVLRLDGSEEATVGDRRHFELKANEVAVWEV